MGGTGAVGYGTTSIDVRQGGTATTTTQQIGVEGSGLGGSTAVGYGTTSIDVRQGGTATTTTTQQIGVEGSGLGGSTAVLLLLILLKLQL